MRQLHALMLRVPGRRLVGQSAAYMMINVLAAFGPLALIPFLTHVLTPESYGVYGNFLAGMGVATVLLGLNMDLVVRRHGREAGPKLRPWVNAALAVTAAMLVLVVVLALLFGANMPGVVGALGVPMTYIPLMLLCGALMVVHNVASLVATMRQSVKVYGLIRLGSVALFVLLAFGLFLGWRQVVGDVLLARVLSLGAAALVGLWWLRRFGAFGVRTLRDTTVAKVKTGLMYGVPLVPAVFFDPMMSFVNRVVLTHHETLNAAGQYAVAYQLAQPLQLVAGSVAIALFPYMMAWHDAKTGEARRKLWLASAGALAAMLGLWALYALGVLPLLLPWLSGAEYHLAVPIVAPLAMCFVIGGFFAVLANRYMHNGQTWWVSVCAVFGLCLNLSLCLLNPTLEGVAWAMLAGYGMTCLWMLAGLRD